MNRRTTLSLAASLALTVLFVSPPVAAQSPAPVETGFINGQVTANGKTMVYVVYVPRNYAPDKQWPVILFLHGSYGWGTDGFQPVFHTLARGSNDLATLNTTAGALGVAVMRNPQRFPCLIVWPQMPSAGDWQGTIEDLAIRILEQVIVKYNGDRNRVYLTGISLGSRGTWMVAADHPDLFAAAMPIASAPCVGPAAREEMAQKLKSLPMWVFQGGKDVEPISCVRALVAAVQAVGNPNIQYTEFPDLGHNVWDMVYDNAQAIAWLLAQKR